MPSFLNDITPFYGTGEKNAAGQTLEEFLDQYDPYKYRTPSCTTDAVIFAAEKPLTKELDGLKILLVKRSNHPSIGFWALPGGFADMEENLDDTARRELQEETGVENLVMEQIATYGDYNRDPRTRVITTAYMALVQGNDIKVQAGDDAADAVWCEVKLEEKEPDEREVPVQAAEKGFCRDCESERYLYHLHVNNEEKGLDTTAVVERTLRRGIIREEKFKVLEPGVIAVDHAAIIVQAMTILQERL